MAQSQVTNMQIRAKTVFLVDENGKREVAISIAQNLANEHGLDLVQVGYNDSMKMPVCKIMDYGKFKYEQSKKNKNKNNHKPVMKEMMFRLRCAEHDIGIKKRKVEGFLSKGSSVKFGVELRGREKAFRQDAKQILQTHVGDFSNIAKYDVIRETAHSVFVMLNPI